MIDEEVSGKLNNNLGKECKKSMFRKVWNIAIAVAIVIVILATGIGIYNSPQKRLIRQLNLGQKYLEDMNYEQAILQFDKAIKIDPMSVEAYLGLAEAYLKMGNNEMALEILKKGYEYTKDESIKTKIDLLEGENVSAYLVDKDAGNFIEETNDWIPKLAINDFQFGNHPVYENHGEEVINSEIIQTMKNEEKNIYKDKTDCYYDGNIAYDFKNGMSYELSLSEDILSRDEYNSIMTSITTHAWGELEKGKYTYVNTYMDYVWAENDVGGRAEVRVSNNVSGKKVVNKLIISPIHIGDDIETTLNVLGIKYNEKSEECLLILGNGIYESLETYLNENMSSEFSKFYDTGKVFIKVEASKHEFVDENNNFVSEEGGGSDILWHVFWEPDDLKISSISLYMLYDKSRKLIGYSVEYYWQ